ncbi:MAG TPA: lipid-A-disaccharide synthase, partial [bacterium]|nr:lipid-A-disaccharide synthase [bacterium]
MMTAAQRLNSSKQHSVMMVAGEASGDILGAGLIQAMRRDLPDTDVWGIGGDRMAAAGAMLEYHVDDLGVTGFTEVAMKLPQIIQVLRRITMLAQNRRPDAVVLIDYPDFNLRLARRLKKAGLTVVYYVSPQLWAWRSGRVRIIRKFVDTLMVLFPFEVEWYRRHGVPAEFVGHPVVDRVRRIPDTAVCRRNLGIGSEEFLIALLPGSRMNEVGRTLPV